jgi:hypothetical protein
VTAPPIPQRCADRPVVGGLVVPYISLVADGRTRLGGTRGIRVAECVVRGLCQICGQPLTDRPILFLATQTMIDEGFSSEPALHPECAAYSVKACPMVAGRTATYNRHPHDATGQHCGVDGCECGGWTTAEGGKAGEPAEAWFRVWVSGYAIGVREPGPVTVGNVTGCVFTGRVVKVRQVAAAVTDA